MLLVVVPPFEAAGSEWPSLGSRIVPWMERNLVFGPGDLRGRPLVLSEERKLLLYRWYEVFPQRHALAGRRRFNTAALSLRKGLAKSELAALVAAAELSPEAPVRCVGWDAHGRPKGGPVTDPYIPIVAFTEKQSAGLVYDQLFAILQESAISDQFDLGLERIMRAGGDGKAEALASSPSARDGAKTSFAVSDETWHWTSDRLKRAHQTMQANLPKRMAADAWGLEVSTCYQPGQGSVAEDRAIYAQAILAGRAKDGSRFCFFHRQASDGFDLTTPEGVRAAVLDATGEADAGWTNFEAIVPQFFDPTISTTHLEQTWLNRPVVSIDRAFDVRRWRELAKPGVIAAGSMVTLGFFGTRAEGAAIVATDILSGHQQLVYARERPFNPVESWSGVPEGEVNAAVAAAVERWEVWRCYAEPAYWETTVSAWSGAYGEDRFVGSSTRKPRFADTTRAFANAVDDGGLSHDGSPDFERHVANAFKRVLMTAKDESGAPMWVPRKERDDSPNRIDILVAACLSWEARRDALTLGIGKVEPEQDYTVDWIE